jgi:hypothetical protein
MQNKNLFFISNQTQELKTMLRTGKFILIILSVFIFQSMPLSAIDKKLADSAGEYICTKAKDGKKKRLAVYPFTEKSGETSPDSQEYATRIIEIIINKNEFKVIDPEKVSKIVEEQEKGLTGLVDPDTAPETGKMIGADAMIFGITGKGVVQIRILDAVTGEVLGATVADKGGSAKTNNDDFKSGDNKNRFMAEQTMMNLVQMHNRNPKKFLYITANDSEYKDMEKNFPVMMNKLKQRFEESDSIRKITIEKKRKRFLQLRSKDSDFDSRIKSMRDKVMDDINSKKGKKK